MAIGQSDIFSFFTKIQSMKIASWNVNGIRAVERKKELQLFLKTHDPDLLFLQEIKGTSDKFSKYLTENPDYETFYNSAEKPGYAGTGVWIKKEVVQNINNLEFMHAFEGDPCSAEGRLSQVNFEKDGKQFSVLGLYFPNGGKSPEAWKDKIIFYEKLLEHVDALRESGREVLWMGDVNCAHQEIDLARAKENVNSIGFLPPERDWISKCVAHHWVDIFRNTYPDKIIYSWWHLISKARARNVGWRIDYIFCDASFFPNIKNIEYLNDQMGSDHCPVLVEI